MTRSSWGRWLGSKTPRATGPSAAPEATPETTREATTQLDRLLEEVHENERRLPADHWTTMAATFEDHVAREAAVEQARGSRLRPRKWNPSAASLLPIGGLAALVGIVLSVSGPSNTAIVQSEESGEGVVPISASEPVTAKPGLVQRFTHETKPASSEPAGETSLPATADTPLQPRPKSAAQRSGAARLREPSPANHADAPANHGSDAPNASGKSRAAPGVVSLTSVTPDTAATDEAPETLDTFTLQLQALKQADKALKSGHSAEARRVLSRDFSPQLEPHALALRAVLACQQRDLAAGKRYLAAQRRHNPNSPYLARIRRACGVEANAKD